MKKYFWRIGGGVLGALVLVFLASIVVRSGFSSVHYSGICTRCLQQVDGVDKFFFGIQYAHEEVLTAGNGNDLMSPAIFGPAIGQTNAKPYEQIFGQPCVHNIIRTGFCRHTAGMYSDGAYSHPPGIESRLALIKRLFETYTRVPDRELARETYAMIDRAYPEKMGRDFESPLPLVLDADSVPNEPMSIIYRALPLLHTPNEWTQVIEAAKAKNGSIGLLNNFDLLTAHLRGSDPKEREQALSSLAALNTPQALALIADMLPDAQLQTSASQLLVWGKHYEYLDRVLPVWNNNWQFETERTMLLGSLSDDDIRALLTQKKAIVDQLCFQAIETSNRFSLLETTLSVLNNRPSPEGEHAIRWLLEGPWPDSLRNSKTHEPFPDPWGLVYEQNQYLLTQSGFGQRRTDDLLRRAVVLSKTSGKETWVDWRNIFAEWWADTAAEFWSTAFAQKMNEADPTVTSQYLIECLAQADENVFSKQPSNILIPMGFLAKPEFLPALQQFEKRSRGLNYDKHPLYRGYVEFAEHRCRHIQDWKLEADPLDPKKYVIVRTDGTVIR